MSESWDRAHARQRLISEVLADVLRSGRSRITRIDELTAEFDGIDGFLLALHQRWYTALYAHLDALLEDPPEEMQDAVAQLWHSLAARHVALRIVLDAHATNPALIAADDRHRRALRRDLGVDLAVLPARRDQVVARTSNCPVISRRQDRRAQRDMHEVA